ncbi:unknown [Prevotella sp. CAG:520]|nr:unknown [Prevotella sp. CAG:520]
MKVIVSLGAVKPMWPAKIPAKSTQVTPSEMPPILILPSRMPTAMTMA